MTEPTAILAAEKGRSLWADAWARLKANRAAAVSGLYLIIMALACIIGPFFTPHHYTTIYQDYNRVPPSLSAYPKTDQMDLAIRDAVKRARLDLVKWEEKDGKVVTTVSAAKPIDERVTRYLDRSDMLENTQVAVTGKSADGLSLTMTSDVEKKYFFFGTDNSGRDVLTRVLMAGRVSLSIGLLAGIVAVVIGVLYGATAGFAGGKTDEIMMRIVDILYALPFIFFVIMLVVFFGRNFILMFLAVGAVMWLDMARIVRGQALSIKRQEYVQAAEALGVTRWGILIRHIVPNLLGPVIIYMTLLVPQVIILESFLSYLGLGVQEPMSSWGVMISQGAKNMPSANWLIIIPAIFLTSTLFALNFIGDGLRDALDPKDR
ncbi:MAG TPA: ABC transporter permease subunit [Aestuariivirga sp.]|nr:ABC transporter permease subunit [Aestuariivirga sp.]